MTTNKELEKKILEVVAKGEEIKALCSELLKVLSGTESTHAIDCDADPFLPNGWRVEEHRKDGVMVWNPTKVSLYLSEWQNGYKCIVGNDLRKELADKPVLNANVLDYLLKHPHLIPKDWHGKEVFFWGTIYRHFDGDLCVRSLYWSYDAWCWSYRWLESRFYYNNPAALRAS